MNPNEMRLALSHIQLRLTVEQAEVLIQCLEPNLEDSDVMETYKELMRQLGNQGIAVTDTSN